MDMECSKVKQRNWWANLEMESRTADACKGRKMDFLLANWFQGSGKMVKLSLQIIKSSL